MYSLLNRNRIPFMPKYPEPILPSNRADALHKRMKGDPLPDLEGVNPELNSIILKACAFNRMERYADPAKMRETLEQLTMDN
jgi:serine/threonine-protein kinase